MKISKLIRLLKKFPPDATVIISKDAEGNGYSPLSDGIEQCEYIKENSWAGDIDFDTENKNAIVLFPVN